MAEALLEAGIRPDVIVGTSVGAVNGVWLAGHPTPEGAAGLRELWLTVRRRDIFPLSPARLALGLGGRRDHVVSSEPLERWLVAHAPFARIEHAAVSLHIMATDLITGMAVRLSAGDVVDAMLASAAIPGIFPPVSLDGRLLVDGGVAADTPIGDAVALGADTVYLLPTVGPGASAARPRGAVSAVMQATAHMLGRAADREVTAQAGRCRLYLVPAPVVTDVSPFRFGRSAELMDTALATARTWLKTAEPAAPGDATEATEATEAPARSLGLANRCPGGDP
jgi:NTE family protein